MQRISICILLTILLNACATSPTYQYQQSIKTWEGKRVEKLVHLWGVPNQLISVPGDLTYYIYTTKITWITPTNPPTVIGTSVSSEGKVVLATTRPLLPIPRDLYAFRCTTQFDVNQQNIIVNVSARGNCTTYSLTNASKL